MEMNNIIIIALESVTAALLAFGIAQAKGLWKSMHEVEEQVTAHRLEVEKKIADIRVETNKEISKVHQRVAKCETA